MDRLPSHTWLAGANSARSALSTDLGEVQRVLALATTAARVTPDLVGAKRPQRYFVALVNPAESRGLGGIPSAFLIIVADRGRFTVTTTESDTALRNVNSGIDLGADYAARYGVFAPTRNYVNSTVSPNFPDAARIWAAMWQSRSGQRVDAAMSVDPAALSYLLRVTGPAPLLDGESITSGTVADLIEQAPYVGHSDAVQHQRPLIDVVRAVADRLLSGAGDHVDLVRAAARAAGERRLLLWSADPTNERRLAPLSIGGVLPRTAAPFAMMTVSSLTGGKLDYYLTRSLSWQAAGCGAERTVTVAMTLTNDVPLIELPTYVTVRNDHPTYVVRPGDNRVSVSYYATEGAELVDVNVDGRPAHVLTQTEQGHPVYVADLEIRRDATRTVVLTLKEPGTGPVTVLTQPLVRPMSVFRQTAGCD